MGPWSRSFIAAVAGNAERPDLKVENLRVDPGVISATVEGCEVTLTAPAIPQRIWAAMTRYAKGMGQLEDGVHGKVQSVHLEHLLEEDWDEVLVPRARSIAQTCECDAESGCDHVVAAAYAFADELETAPRLVLRWRGVAELEEPESESADPWRGKELNAATSSPRPMPTYAVLKRLGSSEMHVASSDDFASALRSAYEAL